MSDILCHHEGRYNFYSTVSDAFCYECSIPLNQVRRVVEERFGQEGLAGLPARLAGLPARLARAHERGHSSLEGGSLEDFLICNRAGPDETELSPEECISQFLS